MNESKSMTKDPICGMTVDQATAIHAERVDNNMRSTLTSARLNPMRLGLGFGATGVVFYLGCMLTMAIVPREQAVVLFNSLLHGFNVDPILRTGVPAAEVVLGLISTFILGWIAGVLIAGIYNLSLRMGK